MSRFHTNPFYFPTGDSQKDSGLEIDFMLDTGAACSIINYGTFLEIAQFRQTITVVRSKQKPKTYTGDFVPMIRHTTLSFSFDPDGEHHFEPRIWITETQTSNLLGIEFCRRTQKQRTLSVTVICVQQNPIPLFQKYTLSKYLIRFILMPKPPEFGNIYRKIDQKTFHQGPTSFLIDSLSNSH